MKLTYNDGTDLQIQSASIQGDGTLLIKTVSATEEDLRAMLWAQQIILGKKTYGQVPRLLKDKVKEILEDSGMADLVKEDEEKA